MNATAQRIPGIAGERLLRKPEVLARVGLGTTSLYARIKEGRFPAPISLGGRAVAWSSSSVESWIADRIAESRGQQAGPREAQR
jgi:prophage regulatory protein